jgi:ribosomal-protein-serine acetyltransferase
MTTDPAVLPERVTDPEGLLLRRWVESDAGELGHAILESAEHLRPWMAWIAEEPLPLGQRTTLINEWEQDWARGGDVLLGVFLEGQIAGGCGLHRRIGPDGLEIGYWIHAACLRRGLATRVARALTGAAFAVPGITRVEIHHDKANQASAGIPRKLGFDWFGEAPAEPVAPADSGIEWRWAMEKHAWNALEPATQPSDPAHTRPTRSPN